MPGDVILAMDDSTAERVLIDAARAFPEDEPTAWSPDLARELAQAFGFEPGGAGAASKGGLARAALLALAHDPRFHGAISGTIPGPGPESFGFVTATAVITAALLILKTHVLIERDKDGKFSVKVETDALPPGVLKGLVEGLLGLADR